MSLSCSCRFPKYALFPTRQSLYLTPISLLPEKKIFFYSCWYIMASKLIELETTKVDRIISDKGLSCISKPSLIFKNVVNIWAIDSRYTIPPVLLSFLFYFSYSHSWCILRALIYVTDEWNSCASHHWARVEETDILKSSPSRGAHLLLQCVSLADPPI